VLYLDNSRITGKPDITRQGWDGDEVNLQRPGTNLEWFRVRTDTLTFVERKTPARTSNPFTNPEPVLDAGEILERIAAVQEENLKRLDADVDILKAYLKTQSAPRTAIEALGVRPRRAPLMPATLRPLQAEGAAPHHLQSGVPLACLEREMRFPLLPSAQECVRGARRV
jgi:uncharacterized small protein (DUF1192 family)